MGVPVPEDLGFSTSVTLWGWTQAQTEAAQRALRVPLDVTVPAADFARLRIRPATRLFLPPPANMVVTTGVTQLWKMAMGDSPDWSVASAGSSRLVVAVGNGATAAAVGQTDLQGSSKSYGGCDNGWPTRSSGTFTVRRTFGAAEANFEPWDEYAIFVPDTLAGVFTGAAVTSRNDLPTSSAVWKMFNRRAPAGISGKSSGTLTIQFAIVAA